jgi:chromosome segregation protein
VFEATRSHFADMVAHLFPGGKGFLKLVEPDGEEPGPEACENGELEETSLPRGARPVPGIRLEIKPPRKAPRSMSLLSGGEKALAAIAFLFALFLAKPCPFYILDEVEAALDDVNIGRFLSLVTRYQDQAQFVIITHQRRTMEIADALYGVAMDTDGTSRVLSRRLHRTADGVSSP